jgi:uncharacterized protein YdaU (DUF1376 family)
MSKADIWMPLYIGDYLADTTRLTTEQHGAYLLLIMDYWRNGPPPDDDSILGNITKMLPKEWRKAKPALMNFFTEKDGAWTHSRIDRELSEAAKGKAKAEEKAKKAAEARWGKHVTDDARSNASSNAPSISQALHEECPLPSQSPLPLKQNKSKAETALATRLPTEWTPSPADIKFCKTERAELRPDDVGDRFRDYWLAQPGLKGRKVDWPATWRNWVRNERTPQARASPGSLLGRAGQATANNAAKWLEEQDVSN